MPVGVIVPLVLLVALVVVGLLIVRRMGRIVAADRTLRGYQDAVQALRRGADPALERAAAATDAALRGQRTAGAGLAECVQASTELEQARTGLRAHQAPPELGSLPSQLDQALGGGADAIERLVAALERLHPGAALDDPGRLAAEREAKRARVAVLTTREDLAALEERIATTVAEARGRTGWRRRPA